jgi:hypothetical protein
MIQSAEVNCTNLFIDWKAFDHIPLDGHISVADLAKKVDAEEALVGESQSPPNHFRNPDRY